MSLREDEQVRQLSDYLSIVRRRFWLIALIAIVTIGAASAYVFTREPVYRSSMKILVGQGEGVFRSELVNATEELTQTASDLLETDIVATTVIEELDLDITSNELLGNLGVATEPSTAVLEVTYDDTDADRGLETLDQVGDTFEELVETELTSGKSSISATTFDDAHALPGQVEPKPIRDLAVAGVLGVLLGLLVAFLREQFDKTIRGVEQAETAFGQAVSGTLPPKLLGFRPFDTDGRKSKRLDPVLAELALQRLRASVFWSWEAGQNRTVVVTSARPEEGKTTVAVNLAVSMAAEGRDVILVDADLRRPLIHEYLNVEVGSNTKGLDAIGRREVAIEDALIDVPLDTSRLGAPGSAARKRAASAASAERQPRLRVMPAAPGHTLPAEFTMDRAQEIVEELRSMADYVIFDAPPILVVSDSFPLVVAVDSVIAIVRNGKSTSPATTTLGRTLARLRLRHVRSAELVLTEIETDVDAGRYSYYSTADNTVGAAPTPAGSAQPSRETTSGDR
jgi:capsular polysaccharide biosynthesis protein/MinD-like ATPase involved in chromosome partitioning or flagellar assembly